MKHFPVRSLALSALFSLSCVRAIWNCNTNGPQRWNLTNEDTWPQLPEEPLQDLEWSEWKLCPAGQFVTALNHSSDTYANPVAGGAIQCRDQGIIDGNAGDYCDWFATGWILSFEDEKVSRVELECENRAWAWVTVFGNRTYEEPALERTRAGCEPQSAICGVRTATSAATATAGQDLSDVEFKCCPQPVGKDPKRNDWSTSGKMRSIVINGTEYELIGKGGSRISPSHVLITNRTLMYLARNPQLGWYEGEEVTLTSCPSNDSPELCCPSGIGGFAYTLLGKYIDGQITLSAMECASGSWASSELAKGVQGNQTWFHILRCALGNRVCGYTTEWEAPEKHMTPGLICCPAKPCKLYWEQVLSSRIKIGLTFTDSCFNSTHFNNRRRNTYLREVVSRLGKSVHKYYPKGLKAFDFSQRTANISRGWGNHDFYQLKSSCQPYVFSFGQIIRVRKIVPDLVDQKRYCEVLKRLGIYNWRCAGRKYNARCNGYDIFWVPAAVISPGGIVTSTKLGRREDGVGAWEVGIISSGVTKNLVELFDWESFAAYGGDDYLDHVEDMLVLRKWPSIRYWNFSKRTVQEEGLSMKNKTEYRYQLRVKCSARYRENSRPTVVLFDIYRSVYTGPKVRHNLDCPIKISATDSTETKHESGDCPDVPQDASTEGIGWRSL